MNKLFLHHRYLDLPPRDVSENANDGTPTAVSPGSGDLRYSARFNGVASWVHVPHTPSMDDLVQLRAQIVFRLDPAAFLLHTAAAHGRLNLVEGHLSFAIFVNRDLSVSFSIVDRDANWATTTSPPSVVQLDRWHTLIAAHDGVAEARLALDADIVARHTDMLGPVRSVQDLGIAIGRWPDGRVYHFHGYLSEVALYKFDPEPEINLLFSADCIDREALDELLRRLGTRMDDQQLVAWARAVQALITEAAQAIHGGEEDPDSLRRLANAAVIGLSARDAQIFTEAFEAYAAHAHAKLGDEGRDALAIRLDELWRQLPLDEDELRELARALCLDRIYHPKGKE